MPRVFEGVVRVRRLTNHALRKASARATRPLADSVIRSSTHSFSTMIQSVTVSYEVSLLEPESARCELEELLPFPTEG